MFFWLSLCIPLQYLKCSSSPAALPLFLVPRLLRLQSAVFGRNSPGSTTSRLSPVSTADRSRSSPVPFPIKRLRANPRSPLSAWSFGSVLRSIHFSRFFWAITDMEQCGVKGLAQGPNSCADLIVATPGIHPPTSQVQVQYLNHYATGWIGLICNADGESRHWRSRIFVLVFDAYEPVS